MKRIIGILLAAGAVALAAAPARADEGHRDGNARYQQSGREDRERRDRERRDRYDDREYRRSGELPRDRRGRLQEVPGAELREAST